MSIHLVNEKLQEALLTTLIFHAVLIETEVTLATYNHFFNALDDASKQLFHVISDTERKIENSAQLRNKVIAVLNDYQPITSFSSTDCPTEDKEKQARVKNALGMVLAQEEFSCKHLVLYDKAQRKCQEERTYLEELSKVGRDYNKLVKKIMGVA